MLYFILVIVLGAGSWFGWRAFRAWRERKLVEEYQEWKTAQQSVTLKILAPKNNEKTPLAAEQMFAALHGVYKESAPFQDEISFEFAAYEKFIHFYVSVPRHLKEFVEGQVYAQYPNVEIMEAEDYTQLVGPDLKSLVAEITLTKDDVYPIKTFLNFTVDPLSGITAVLGNIGPGEQLWIQLIAKPVPENWQERGVKYVANKRTGVGAQGDGWLSTLLRGVSGIFVAFLRTALQPAAPTATETAAALGGQSEQPGQPPKLSAPEEVALKGVEEKVTKLGFETKIRFVALARDDYAARSRIEALTGAFKQFNSTNLNGFKMLSMDSDPSALAAYIARDFSGIGPVLNTEELASVYHLPAVSVETPNIAWAGSKKGEPPANLPLEGQAGTDEVTFFGITDFRNFKEKFGIKAKDRRLHMYTIGKTGTGKSTLLLNMIIDDIAKGRGVGVVDPHGQLAADILDRIPSHRLNDVIYFNPADRDNPIGFNILENVEPDLRSVVASGVVGIFQKLFAESWGPRLEYILRNAVLALLYYPDSTLLGVNRILVDDEFRSRVVRKVEDPVVRDFFLEEYNKYDPKFRREAIASIQNKTGQFLSSPTIRNIIGQPRSTFNMRTAMDEGKIVLMDLSIGRIGEDNTKLLGSMLITKVQLAAMSRADVLEDKRRDFYLYVDEFQNFATEAFAVILSEARKYHLNLVLTNQYIAQMPEEVAQAVFGNVGTIVSYRVGAGDAAGLVREFEPVFEAIDLVNLDNYHVYVKMAVDGVTRPAFSAMTLPSPPVLGTEHIEKIIRVSRERYAKPRSMVEQKIIEWSDDVQVKQAQEWRKRIEGKGEGKGQVALNEARDARPTPSFKGPQSGGQPSQSSEKNSKPQPSQSQAHEQRRASAPGGEHGQRQSGGGAGGDQSAKQPDRPGVSSIQGRGGSQPKQSGARPAVVVSSQPPKPIHQQQRQGSAAPTDRGKSVAPSQKHVSHRPKSDHTTPNEISEPPIKAPASSPPSTSLISDADIESLHSAATTDTSALDDLSEIDEL